MFKFVKVVNYQANTFEFPVKESLKCVLKNIWGFLNCICGIFRMYITLTCIFLFCTNITISSKEKS